LEYKAQTPLVLTVFQQFIVHAAQGLEHVVKQQLTCPFNPFRVFCPKNINLNNHGCNPWQISAVKKEPRSGFNMWFALFIFSLYFHTACKADGKG
jgi:hypothetical protein